jgi:hypothetical protein
MGMSRTFVAALLLLAACGSEPAADAAPDPDDDMASALVVCPDALGVVEDAADGLITTAEFREEFRPVVERAEGTAVEEDVKGVMRAVTQGWSENEVAQAVASLGFACERALADDEN